MTLQNIRYFKYCVLAFVVALQAANWMMPPSWDASPARASKEQFMRAIVYPKHGDVLQLDTHFAQPVPRKHQVLVQVMASSLNPVDFKLRRNTALRWLPLLIPLPKIPGADIAGVVVDPNRSKKFQKGDRVAAMLPMLGARWGAHADYVAVDESLLAKINSDKIDFEMAAAIPLTALTVLQDFRALQNPGKDQKILIQAGAGGVGTFAIQYAKHVLGMSYVATTASKPKEALLKDLGADLVIDYRTDNFEEIIQDYDVVLDPMSWLYEELTLTTNVLKPTGHYLNVPSSDWSFVNGVKKSNGLASFKNLVKSRVQNFLHPGTTPKYSMVFVTPSGDDLQLVLDLIEKGTIRPIIDKKFHLSEAQQAYEYLEQGGATGKVVLYHTDKPAAAAAAASSETIDTTTTTTTTADNTESTVEQEEPVVEEEPQQEQQPGLDEARE